MTLALHNLYIIGPEGLTSSCAVTFFINLYSSETVEGRNDMG